MFTRSNISGKDRMKNIQQAYKRSKHFCKIDIDKFELPEHDGTLHFPYLGKTRFIKLRKFLLKFYFYKLKNFLLQRLGLVKFKYYFLYKTHIGNYLRESKIVNPNKYCLTANMLMFYFAKDGRDYAGDLEVLDYWAFQLNSHFDSHKVEGDKSIQYEMACFLKALFFNPSLLQVTK